MADDTYRYRYTGEAELFIPDAGVTVGGVDENDKPRGDGFESSVLLVDNPLLEPADAATEQAHRAFEKERAREDDAEPRDDETPPELPPPPIRTDEEVRAMTADEVIGYVRDLPTEAGRVRTLEETRQRGARTTVIDALDELEA